MQIGKPRECRGREDDFTTVCDLVPGLARKHSDRVAPVLFAEHLYFKVEIINKNKRKEKIDEMSIFPASTAAALAESLGFKLSDEALSLLTHDAEYRLREVVHGAQLAMNVCHREKLVRGIFIAHLADVDSALKLLGMAPLLGHTNNVAPVFRKVANVHYQEDQGTFTDS